MTITIVSRRSYYNIIIFVRSDNNNIVTGDGMGYKCALYRRRRADDNLHRHERGAEVLIKLNEIHADALYILLHIGTYLTCCILIHRVICHLYAPHRNLYTYWCIQSD